MFRTRSFVLMVCALFLGFAATAPAQAARPEFDTTIFDGSEQFVYASCNGFDVLISLNGFIKTSFRSTKDGGAVIIDRYRLESIWTNSVTGTSISSPDVGIAKVTVTSDGATTVAAAGLSSRIVVPGQGVVAIDAGRTVFSYSSPDDVEPDVVFEAGPRTGDTSAPTLCGLLQ
jgi:hypothetical protein